jgi:hypothetical protein
MDPTTWLTVTTRSTSKGESIGTFSSIDAMDFYAQTALGCIQGVDTRGIVYGGSIRSSNSLSYQYFASGTPVADCAAIQANPMACDSTMSCAPTEGTQPVFHKTYFQVEGVIETVTEIDKNGVPTVLTDNPMFFDAIGKNMRFMWEAIPGGIPDTGPCATPPYQMVMPFWVDSMNYEIFEMAPGDTNMDGQTDFKDLGMVLGFYGYSAFWWTPGGGMPGGFWSFTI